MPSPIKKEEPFQQEDSIVWFRELVEAALPEDSEERKQVLAELSAPLTVKHLEKAVQMVEDNGNDALKEQLLDLIQLHYLKRASAISPPILDFVLQQDNPPILVNRVCFIIMLMAEIVHFPVIPGSGIYARTVPFIESDYAAKISGKVFRCLAASNARQLDLVFGQIIKIEYTNAQDNAVNRLVALFNRMLSYNALDNALKTLLLLSLTGNYLDEGKSAYKECANRGLACFEKGVDFYYPSNNQAISAVYHRLAIFLKQDAPDVRLFAAQATLAVIYHDYLKHKESDSKDDARQALRAIFLPALLERWADRSFEIKKLVACSLCYLDIQSQVDRFEPQRLVYHTEALLEVNNSVLNFDKMAVLGLAELNRKYVCILSREAMAKLVHFGLQPDAQGHVKNAVLYLLACQVDNTDLPLPIEIIEQCFNFIEPDMALDKKMELTKQVLALMAGNFKKQEDLTSLPAALPDAMLDCFEMPNNEVRISAYNAYKSAMLVLDGSLKSSLMQKMLAKLRDCARKEDAASQDFTALVVGTWKNYQEEKNEILEIIQQSKHLKSLAEEDLEKALQVTVKGGSEQDQIALKKQQLSLIFTQFSGNKTTVITEPVLDFIMQQYQVPALISLADQVCFIILLKVNWVSLPVQSASSGAVGAVCFWGRDQFSAILDRLYQCAIDADRHRMKDVLSAASGVEFADSKKDAITSLVETFRYTLKYPQFGNAIKILLLLAEVGDYSQAAKNAYKACSNQYINTVEKMIEIHRASNKPLPIHRVLTTFLNHHNADVRIFAAKVLLISVHRSFIVTYIDRQSDWSWHGVRDLVLPTLLEKLTDTCLAVRPLVAAALCHLDASKLVDPQLLVCYTEEMLESSDVRMQRMAVLGLGWLFYDCEAVLSEAVVSKILSLYQKPDFFPDYVKANVLNLLNYQVRHSGLPLPMEAIEQCFASFKVKDASSSDQARLAEAILKLLSINLEKSEVMQSASTAIFNAVLNCFDLDLPEPVKDIAVNASLRFMTLSNSKIKVSLITTFFAKFRDCARKDDPELHKFVIKHLKQITTVHPEIDEIFSIIEQTKRAEKLSIEVVALVKPSIEKDLDTLFSEFKVLNANSPEVLALLEGDYLRNALAAVRAAYKADSSFMPVGKPIEAWEVGDCQAWANAVKQNKVKAFAKDFEAEMLALMVRASVLDSGQMPRNIQLLSALILLESPQGRLLEVKTSEGKTKLTCMYVAINALRLDFIDVSSSSTVLAKREARETKNFYSILSLTVAHNIEGNDHDGKAARPCYSANVVYGETNSFQWDIIRELMGGMITRGGRPFRFLFFDEVDSLLIDRSQHAAMISNHLPGMEYIKPLIVSVWYTMVKLAESIKRDNGQWVYQPPGSTNEIRFDDVCVFAESLLKKYIIRLTEESGSPVLVPKHLKNFLLEEAEALAEAAAGAYYRYRDRENYLITDNDNWNGESRLIVSPVDAHLTGEIQKNTRWDFRHCFLELKHGLQMGAPSLMGNYLSTPGLCQRYDKIFGLTGTLGGADTQALLKETYHVDMVFVPTYKPKCFEEYDGLVVPNKDVWLRSIINNVKAEVDRKRPVLVIANTILDVVFLEKAFIKESYFRKITRYSRNDTEEGDIPEHDMEVGEVVIATLLAGRGIDWHFQKHQDAFIEQQGGLHILITFLPPNLRVEQQIFGRTSRRGNSGTAQIIVNRDEVRHIAKGGDLTYLNDMNNLKRWRDGVEAKRVHGIKTKSIRLALLKDDLYLRFRRFIDSIKGDELANLRIKSIEEQWAFWLRSVFSKLEDDFNPDTTFQLIEAKFNEFMQVVSHDADVVRKNTCLQVQRGNLLNFGSEKTKCDFPAAINLFSQAISDDPIVGVQAYYNRAQAYIFTKGEGYKEAALSDLKMAKANLEKHIIPQLQSMLVVNNLNPLTADGFNNDFARQTHNKIELLKLELRNIDENIHVIEESIRAAHKNKQKVDFEVTGYQMLHKFFASEESTPKSEIDDLTSAGLMHLFTLEPFFKNKKHSGFGAFCVAFLGLVQIAVGVLMSYTVPMIGSALIQEGINDLMFAAKAFLSGNFSWDAYLATKVGSVSITIISMGLDVLKNSADLEVAAEAAKGKSTLERIISRQLSHKEVLERAQKEIITRLVDTGVREVFNFTVDKLTTVAMDGFSDEIKQLIIQRLKENLDGVFALNAMLTLQLTGSNDGNTMRNALLNLSLEAIREKSNPFKRVANSIIKGVLANQHKDIGVFIRVADMGRALDEVFQLADRVAQKLNTKLLYFYHKNTGKLANIVVDQQAIADLKAQFFADMAERLTKRIIAISKGEIIHPGVDMAMSEHLNTISNTIKQAALRPTAPEPVVPAPQPKSAENPAPEPVEPKVTPAAFKEYLESKRKSARDAALTSAFKKTMKPVLTTKQPAAAPLKSEKLARPESAKTKPAQTYEKPAPTKAARAPNKAAPAPHASPTASRALVPSQSAKLKADAPAAEQAVAYLNAFSSGVSKGFVRVIGNCAYVLGHPFETMEAAGKAIYEAGLLMYDVRVVGAKHAPMGPMINVMDPDFDLLQRYLAQRPSIALKPTQRMVQRRDAVSNKAKRFMNASGPEKLEMATDAVVAFLAPGALMKGAVTVANVRQFGIMRTPPLFHNIGEANTLIRHNIGIENAVTPPGLIKYLDSPEMIRLLNKGNGEYMYVLTKDKRLWIGDGQTKMPANWDRAQEMAIFHPELAQLQPVYAAGKFKVVDGFISKIMNNSGHYLPHGDHLNKLIEGAFVKKGFHEARGKFEPVNSLISPETRAKLTYPGYANTPKMLTMGSAVTTLTAQRAEKRKEQFEARFVASTGQHRATRFSEDALAYFNAFSSGAYKGLVEVAGNTVYVLGHPFETIEAAGKAIYDLGLFMNDVQAMGAKHTLMGPMIDVMNPDFTMAQNLAQGHMPNIALKPIQRMVQRRDAVVHQANRFMNASGPKKLEMATNAAVTFFAPGALAKGAMMVVNLPKFEALVTLPLLRKGAQDISFIKQFHSAEQIRSFKDNGEYMYALTEDKRLFFAGDGRIKMPPNFSLEEVMAIYNPESNEFTSINAIGKFKVVDGRIHEIKKGYAVHDGDRLIKSVERAFIRNGFVEARGKFESVLLRASLGNRSGLNNAGYLGVGVGTVLAQQAEKRKEQLEVTFVASLKQREIARFSEEALAYLSAFPSGAYKGIVRMIDGYIYAFGHPFETIEAAGKALYEAGLLMHDVRVMGAKHTPIGPMINVMDPDFTMLQHQLAQMPSIALKPTQRMAQRRDAVVGKAKRFMAAPGPKKLEKVVEEAVTFFTPSAIIGGTKMIINYRQFGLLKTPPLFNNIFSNINDSFVPQTFIRKYTPDQILKEAIGLPLEGEYMYVITWDKKLIISDGGLVFPANREWSPFAATFKVPHSNLSGSKPVFAAGWFKAVGEEFHIATLHSGHFKPSGKHLKTLVEHVFIKNGFHDARGKFLDILFDDTMPGVPVGHASSLMKASVPFSLMKAIPTFPNDAILPGIAAAFTATTQMTDQHRSSDRPAKVKFDSASVPSRHSVSNEDALPVFLPEDLGGFAFRSKMKMPGNTWLKPTPLTPFLLTMNAEIKSHNSMAQYYLDFAMMYPPIRYLEGLTLIGNYSKEHGLHQKAIQSWSEKLQARDLFADESFRAATMLVLLEDFATGFSAVKEYTVSQMRERIEQLEMLVKILMLTSNATDALAEMAAQHSSNKTDDWTTKTVRIFDANRKKEYNNPHRLFFRDNVNREETLLAKLDHDFDYTKRPN